MWIVVRWEDLDQLVVLNLKPVAVVFVREDLELFPEVWEFVVVGLESVMEDLVYLLEDQAFEWESQVFEWVDQEFVPVVLVELEKELTRMEDFRLQ